MKLDMGQVEIMSLFIKRQMRTENFEKHKLTSYIINYF